MKKILVISLAGLVLVLAGCSLNTPNTSQVVNQTLPTNDQNTSLPTADQNQNVIAPTTATDCGNAASVMDNSKIPQNTNALSCFMDKLLNDCQSVKLTLNNVDKSTDSNVDLTAMSFIRNITITEVAKKSQDNCKIDLVNNETQEKFSCDMTITPQIRQMFTGANRGTVGGVVIYQLLSQIKASVDGASKDCYGVYINKMISEKGAANNTAPVPTSVSTPLDTIDNWVTFKSNFFTLSFKAPTGFDIKEAQNYILIAKSPYSTREIGDDNAFFRLTRFDKYNTYDSVLAEYRKMLKNKQESTVSIDGSSFIKITGDDWGRFEGDSAGKVTAVFFKASYLEIIERPLNANQSFNPIALGDKILSTFKFSK